MLVDPKVLGKPPVFFSGRDEDFYVWAKKVENYVSGVFPNVRGALAFAAESQDAVTAASVAVGVPELGVGDVCRDRWTALHFAVSPHGR